MIQNAICSKIAGDGVDKTGKTTVLREIEKRLGEELELSSNEITIVKFNREKFSQETIAREIEINTSKRDKREKLLAHMGNFLEGEINNYQKECLGKKITILDRSRFSFIATRGIALGYTIDRMVDELWPMTKGLPMPDIFIHTTADAKTIQTRFDQIIAGGGKLTDTDKLILKDIPGSLATFEKILNMQSSPIPKDKVIKFDTSRMYIKDGINYIGERRDKQIENIMDFIYKDYNGIR